MLQRIAMAILLIGTAAGLAFSAVKAPASGLQFVLAIKPRYPVFMHYDIKKQSDTLQNRTKMKDLYQEPSLSDLQITYPAPGKLVIGTSFIFDKEHFVKAALIDKRVQEVYGRGRARETRRELLPLGQSEMAVIKDLIMEQLQALKKIHSFNYSFPKCNDPMILPVKFSGIKNEREKNRILQEAMPQRGLIEFRFLPKGYQAIPALIKNQPGQYIIRDAKQATILPEQALKLGSRALRGQNLLPLPRIIRSRTSWSVTYTLKPEMVKNFVELTKAHQGEYLVFAIDNIIYAAINNPSLAGRDKITVKVKPPANVNQAELFQWVLNSRPFPAPLMVKYNQ
jgi:hypothetical protein